VTSLVIVGDVHNSSRALEHKALIKCYTPRLDLNAGHLAIVRSDCNKLLLKVSKLGAATSREPTLKCIFDFCHVVIG
jgi:hypothetical protein